MYNIDNIGVGAQLLDVNIYLDLKMNNSNYHVQNVAKHIVLIVEFSIIKILHVKNINLIEYYQKLTLNLCSLYLELNINNVLNVNIG